MSGRCPGHLNGCPGVAASSVDVDELADALADRLVSTGVVDVRGAMLQRGLVAGEVYPTFVNLYGTYEVHRDNWRLRIDTTGTGFRVSIVAHAGDVLGAIEVRTR